MKSVCGRDHGSKGLYFLRKRAKEWIEIDYLSVYIKENNQVNYTEK